MRFSVLFRRIGCLPVPQTKYCPPYSSVLQRVRFVGVSGDTGWEGKMSCFHGRIAMIDSDVHDETPPL